MARNVVLALFGQVKKKAFFEDGCQNKASIEPLAGPEERGAV
jgi:hypothetical protein